MKIAIIGGGASGLVAAIEAKRQSPKTDVVIVEKLDRVGKKILATGNGRCNYTNLGANTNNYHGENNSFVTYVLKEFTVDNTVNFFNQLGIFPKEEEKGKLYPFSLQASSVLDGLRYEVDRLGIEIINNFYVADIKYNKKLFKLTSKDLNVVLANKVIVCGGGCASKSLGSDGSCFKILEDLGHSITDLSPALVQLKTDVSETKALKGIKIYGNVSVIENDIVTLSEYGEILFTDYGVSGPPIFQISAKTAFKTNLKLSMDFMYEYNHKQIFDILKFRKESLSHLTMENYFTGLLNKRLGNIIAKRSGIEKLSFKVSNLTDDILWSMVKNIKEFTLVVTGDKGFNSAQVTAGGVRTREFYNETLESKIVKGLYACGEVLDIYGDCGGYNLQWAWSSGRLAGRSAALSLKGL
ncbi:MAG: NAD(P)/FAD-dependent oxidoreductase [Lachnospirales bacterium]